MSLDIFSKKQKTELKPEIIVDFRERNSLVPSELVNIGCNIQFKQLEVGDYISGKYIVERKTLADLQSSVTSKRIFNQIAMLKSQENPIFIIEQENQWKLNENALRGLILFITKQNIPVIFSKNPEDTSKYILLLSKQNKDKKFSLRPYKKLDSKQEIMKYILEGFPNIGPITAEKLIKKFNSIRKIFLAPESELASILGNKYNEFKRIID